MPLGWERYFRLQESWVFCAFGNIKWSLGLGWNSLHGVFFVCLFVFKSNQKFLMDVSQVSAHCWSVIIKILTQKDERHILAMMFSYPFLLSVVRWFWMHEFFGGMLKCWYLLPDLIYNRALHLLYMGSEMLFTLKTLSSSLENDDALYLLALLTYLLLEAAPWGCIWTSWPFFSFFWHPQWGANPSEAMTLHCTKSLNLAPQLPSTKAPRQNSRKRDLCKILQVLEWEPSSWSVHPCLFSKRDSEFQRERKAVLVFTKLWLLFWRHSVAHGKCCLAPKIWEIGKFFLHKTGVLTQCGPEQVESSWFAFIEVIKNT